MTQNECWLARYKEVEAFIETNQRNSSKYYPEDKLMVHFLRGGANECRSDIGFAAKFVQGATSSK